MQTLEKKAITPNDFIKLNNLTTRAKEGALQYLKYDKEALNLYLEYLDGKTVKFKSFKEKMDFLFDEGYYLAKMKEWYSYSDMEYIFDLAKKQFIGHQSFMDANKFYESYALRTFDNESYLEDFTERIAVISLHIAKGDIMLARDFVSSLARKHFQPATPIMINGGLQNGGELISCFLDEIPDTLRGINAKNTEASYLSKIGGGVAYNLDYIRGKGDPIKNRDGASSGPLPFGKMFESVAVAVDQLGQREGSIALYLSIWHWDFIEFLDTKKISADEFTRFNKLSIGANIPDIFFDKAEKDEEWYFFSPYSVEKKYGKAIADMDIDTMYDVLVADPDIKKKKSPLSARELLDKIASTMIQSGYPYIHFISNSNKLHMNDNVGKIKLSNLCTEIFQGSQVTEYTKYGEKDDIGYGILCCLSSINLYYALQDGTLAETSEILVKFLSNVLTLTELEDAPSISRAKDELRAIGIGLMNYTGTIYDKLVSYGSKESLQLADLIGMTVFHHALKASNELAREYGAYEGYEGSKYGTGEFWKIKDYLTRDYGREMKEVKEKFFNEDIPSLDDWNELRLNMEEHGLYNAYLMAIAPNQSSAYIQNATSGVMPNTQIIEERKYGNLTTYFPMPFLREDNFLLWARTAYNMDMKTISNVVGTFQRHVDQGISTTMFYNASTPTSKIVQDIYYGHKIGLKSFYYVRPNNDSSFDEGCIACGV